MSKENLLNIGVIGMGNAGGMMANLASKHGFDAMAINASEKDLTLLDGDITKIPVGDGRGTGKSRDEAKEFFKWMYELEVNKNGIPKEDITIALTLPISTSQKLMLKRYNGSAAMMDIHEKNIGFLEKASRTLDLACDYLPTIGYNWVKLDCSDDNGDVLPMGDISEKIFNLAIKTIERKI